MNTRYNNPHQQYQMLQQQQLLQRQLLQQQNQAQGNPMQQMNPQAMMMWLQQNPQFMMAAMQQMQQQPSNGMMPQQMMPNGMMQHPMMGGQQFPMQQGGGRFGGGSGAMEPGVFQTNQNNQPQQQLTEGGPGGRYQQQQQEEQPQEEFEGIPVFVVNNKAATVPLTKKLPITPKVTAFNVKQLASIQEVAFSFSLEDAVDELVAKAKEVEEEKLIFTIDSVVINDTFKAPFDPGYTKLFSDDVKALYKRLRSLYETAVHMDTVIMLERVDKMMTEATNHYLKINFNDELSISRFSTDFNDLLKVLRTNYEDEEDDLWEYLSKEILEIHNLLDQAENQKYEFSIIKPITLVYFKDHHYKAGLKDLPSGMSRLPAEPHNEFLISMTMSVKELCDRRSFYLATYDRNIYRFSVNNKDEVFVEQIG